jgi:membrane-associated phospholipid phosphatase
MRGYNRKGALRWISLVPWTLAVVLDLSATVAHAGTNGFGLGLEHMPMPSSGDRQSQEPSSTPWQRPDEPIQLLPPAVHQTPAFGARLRDDVVSLAMVPLEWEGADWRKLGLGVLAVGAVSVFDERVNEWSDRTRSDSTVRAIEAYRPLGEEGGLALLGAAWLAGRATGRPKLTAVAEDGLEATILAAGVLTPILKLTFGRARPGDTARAYELGGSGRSFPSGETAQAFAIASVIAAHSESRWVRGLAWSSAGLVGLGRVGLDGHWASDVAAGALIGASVGRWVVRRNRPDLEHGLQVTWVPTVARDRYGLAMNISF